MNLACLWDLVTPHRIIGWEDPRLEDEVWNLIGLSLRAVERCPDGNPRFAFEAGYRIEVHADTAVDPWVLRTPDCTFVGRAAGTADTGSSALAVVRDRSARTVSRRLGR